MTYHYPIGGSSFTRVEACPGSVHLCKLAQPQPTNEAMERGTRIHQYAALIGEAARRFIPTDADPEEVAHAERYVAALPPDGDYELQVEESPNVGGTADWVGLYQGELAVVDLKTGTEPVRPSDDQLLFYGALAGGATWLGVYQEAVYGNQIEWYRASYLHDVREMDKRIAEAERQAFGPQPPLRPGAHCRRCPAAGICHMNKRDLAKITDEPRDPVLLSDEQLVQVATLAPRIEDFVDKCKAELKVRASVRAIPGVQLRTTQGRLKWAGKAPFKKETDMTPYDVIKEGKTTEAQLLADGLAIRGSGTIRLETES